jgi:ElaB/YqjD/DUF883 family membrane-anchored ribosome-binding protein
MVTKQMLHGTWHEVVGRLKEKWGQLNQDELEEFRGNIEALSGYIQRHTGEARDTIMRFLDELLTDGSEKAAQAGDTVRGYAEKAASTARHGFERVASGARHGYEGAEHFVRDRPATSVGAAFAAGALIGFVLAMLLHEN